MRVRTLVNLTPHPVHLIGEHGTVELPLASSPARLVLAPDEPLDEIQIGPLTVPIVRTSSTVVVTGLPDPATGVLLIVARAVATALPDRHDLAYPHDAVRDHNGVVIGCRALGVVTPPADIELDDAG
jgi:hypothetical protein